MSPQKTIKLTAKALLLTFIYMVEVVVISGVLIAAGLSFPPMQVDQLTSFLQLAFAGSVISIFTIYLTEKYKLSKKHLFLLLIFILFLSNISVAIEGYMFSPQLITPTVFLTLFIQQLLISLIYSLTAVLFNHKMLSPANTSIAQHISFAIFVRLAICALFYMSMYYLWGKINYSIFTHPYYEAGINGLSIPDGNILMPVILFRGLLIALSAVPFLLFAMPDNRLKPYETGLILFVFGGMLPLSFTAGIFPIPLILFSLAEVFLQNFISGLFFYSIFKSDSFKRAILFR